MKRKFKYLLPAVCIILCLCLVGSNLIWYKLYAREKHILKTAVIPSVSDDYFTSQLNAVKNFEAQPFDDEQYVDGDISEKYYDDKDIYIERKEYLKSLYDQYYQVFYDNDNRDAPDTYSQLKNVIFDIPYISQNPDYPNGCEAASAVMLLNWAGIDISLKDFISKYLPRSDVYDENGYRYGPDPSVYYAGDPADASRGWGVFEPAVYTAMSNVATKKYEDSEENPAYIILKSSNTYGKIPLSTLADRKEPAIIWVTQDYSEASDVYEWFSYDRKKTYTYPKNAHVVVLTGSDENSYYINDPLKGKNIKVDKETLENSFNSMGAQYISLMEYYY